MEDGTKASARGGFRVRYWRRPAGGLDLPVTFNRLPMNIESSARIISAAACLPWLART